MFAIPEHTVLPPLAHRPLIPTALVRAVVADQRWRELLASEPQPGPLRPLSLPWDDPRVEVTLAVLPPLLPPLGPGPVAVRRYDAPQGAFAVLDGQVVEHANGRCRTLRPGQVRVFGPGYRHAVVNAGAEPAVVVRLQILA